MLLFIVNTFSMCKINNVLAQYCGHSITLTERAQNLIFSSTKKQFKLKLKLWNIVTSCLKCKYIRMIFQAHLDTFICMIRGWDGQKLNALVDRTYGERAANATNLEKGTLSWFQMYHSLHIHCNVPNPSFFIVTSVIVLLIKIPLSLASF